MFEIGDYVVCGNKGVCSVENITTLNISGVDKDKKYYILKPVYSPASTVYMPVDVSGESMRGVMTREEAESLISRIPEMELLTITNDKFSEQVYKGCLKSNSPVELVKMIKTISQRKQKRIAAGRKITAVDARYLHVAVEGLYGELAVVLGMSRGEVDKYLEDMLAGKSVLVAGM